MRTGPHDDVIAIIHRFDETVARVNIQRHMWVGAGKAREKARQIIHPKTVG